MFAPLRPVRLRRDPATRVPALLAGALLAMLACVSPSRAGADDPSAHPVLRDFQPTGKYVLVAEDPKDTKARVFFSARAAAYLVRDCSACCSFLVRTGAGVLESVPEEALLCRDDGGCDIRSDVQLTSLGRFSIDGMDIRIKIRGLCARLQPPPPVLGWQRLAHILDHTPEYGRDAKTYKPDAEAVKALASRTERIQVFVYFGSWCTVCSTLMGRIVRTEQESTKDKPPQVDAKDTKDEKGVDRPKPNLTFDYYGLPPAPEAWDDPEAKLRDITKLPMLVVYVDQKYVGKIAAVDAGRPEVALANLLKK